MEHPQKESVCKNVILCYYNRCLRDRGVISERDYLRLSHLINTKYPAPHKEK